MIGGAAIAFQLASFTSETASGRLSAAAWIAASGASLATGLVVTFLTRDRGLYGAWSL